MESDFVVVGRIGRAHGIQGEVSVEPLTDEPDRRFVVGVSFGGTSKGLTVTGVRRHQGRLLVRFDEVADRTAAEGLRGTELTAPVVPGERPENPEEFYDHQLVGLRVESPGGERLGEVVRVEHGAAQDLLVVRTPEHEVLVPFVQALVPDVDLPGGRLVVDDGPGLFAAAAEG